MEFLKRNIEYKIFALLLSISIWFYLNYIPNYNNLKLFKTTLKIPITFENVDKNLKIIPSVKEVIIEVKGSRRAIKNIKPSYFKAFVDLEGKKKNKYTMLPIEISKPANVDVVKIIPSTVDVILDKVVKKEFLVKIKRQGNPIQGYVVEKITISPKVIKVKGAELELNTIKEAQVRVNVSNLYKLTKEKLPVLLIDKDNHIISDIVAIPQFVKVLINIKPKFQYITLPIIPNFKGTLSGGRYIYKIKIVPNVIYIKKNIERKDITYIKTKYIDLSKIKNNYWEGEIGLKSEKDIIIPLKKVIVKLFIKKLKNSKKK